MEKKKDGRLEKWRLAEAHKHGADGAEVDKPKALGLFEEAAELGHWDSMCRLVMACGFRGLGVEMDELKALRF